MRILHRLENTNQFTKYVLVLVCVMLVSGCAALFPNLSVAHHTDRLVVMESHNRVNLAGNQGLVKICREFYRHYEDVFDVLVLVYHSQNQVVDLWGSNVGGRMAVVRHNETGTGTNALDIGRVFGSKHRLKGVVQLASPEEILDGVLLHELMHLWVF